VQTARATTSLTRSSRSGSPRPYHHGHLREALLDAAEEILVGRGGSSLGLRGVARLAKVSHSALYHHFADWEAVLRAVATRGFDRLGAALVAKSDPADRRRCVQEMGVAYVRFAIENPALFRLMFGSVVARGSSGDAALRAARDGAFRVLLAGVKRLHQNAGEAAVQRRAVATWSVGHGLAALLLDEELAFVGLSAADHVRIARDILSGKPRAAAM
jgi:AcrR family transcriptional regulator